MYWCCQAKHLWNHLMAERFTINHTTSQQTVVNRWYIMEGSHTRWWTKSPWKWITSVQKNTHLFSQRVFMPKDCDSACVMFSILPVWAKTDAARHVRRTYSLVGPRFWDRLIFYACSAGKVVVDFILYNFSI